MPAKPTVPSRTTPMAPGTATELSAPGFQPRPRPTGIRTAAWTISTATMVMIFAPSSRGRPSGVEPSRLSTP